MSIEEELTEAIRKSLIKKIQQGDWLGVEYADRPSLSSEVMRNAFNQIDMDRVMKLVTHKLEERVADKMLHAMATEVSNDVKQILCDKERRETLRGVLRAALERIVPDGESESTHD